MEQEEFGINMLLEEKMENKMAEDNANGFVDGDVLFLEGKAVIFLEEIQGGKKKVEITTDGKYINFNCCRLTENEYLFGRGNRIPLKVKEGYGRKG